MKSAVAGRLEFCRATHDSLTVITSNASHLCMIRRDLELAQACRAAHLTVAGGMSVVWSPRASDQAAPERKARVDLMARLLAAAREHRLRVHVLGTRREAVSALVERSRTQHPGLEIACIREGCFGPGRSPGHHRGDPRQQSRHAVDALSHQGDLVRAPPSVSRGARHRGRGRRLRRAGGLHQAGYSLATADLAAS
jgi:hypothetical protein